jgi:hypothetical protein
MILETFLLAVIVGLILRGRISRLAQVQLRGTPFIWVGLILRYLPLLFRLPFLKNYIDIITPYAPALFILSFILLIIGVAFNIARWPMIPILAGVTLNFAVVLANKGFMPVSEECLIRAGYDMSKITSTALDMNHVLMTAQTRLPFLADIVAIPKPYPLPQIISIGDILLCAGLFLFILKAMSAGKKDPRPAKVKA